MPKYDVWFTGETTPMATANDAESAKRMVEALVETFGNEDWTAWITPQGQSRPRFDQNGNSWDKYGPGLKEWDRTPRPLNQHAYRYERSSLAAITILAPSKEEADMRLRATLEADWEQSSGLDDTRLVAIDGKDVDD